jgi:DNA polymerase-3 subunit epsilon
LASAAGLWAALSAGLIWRTLPADLQARLAQEWAGRWPLALMMWVFAALIACWAAAWAHRRWLMPIKRLSERVAQASLQSDLAQVKGDDLPALASLVAAVNELLAQRQHMAQDVDQRVREASARVQAERNQLAALMAELQQAVVVCNAEGQVLLFNQRARLQFKTLAPAQSGAWLGVGRSVYGYLDAERISHALREIEVRLERGASNPSASFVTSTARGHLLRVQVASIAAEQDDTPRALGGFVLLVENITREVQEQAEHDALLNGLTERGRASLANIRTAVSQLQRPEVDEPTRVRLRATIAQEADDMQRRMAEAARRANTELVKRWPLQDMLGQDLVWAAERQLKAWVPVNWVVESVAPALWLRVDSYSLVQALAHLATRLHEAFALRHLRLRLLAQPQAACLDLVWTGEVMSTETAMSWELDPMQVQDNLSSLSVRDVLERHGAALWFERERVRHEAFFRIQLPSRELAQEDEEGLSADAERPEFFDFDLFAANAQSHALDERELSALVYTVFDTETTGMNPSGGDEIIQLGAVRIVNGRLMPGESMDQLVDPQRDIPAATIPVHGITPDMVQGQPKILEVLPQFHAFARDTVLVAHNAAFDMRLLELKEQACGLRFDQPVLDTLLLSAVASPEQESHRLDAIAERMGITVTGRHTAMGDALVTAQVLLRLIPLLQAKGIRTLGQAREAAQKTYYARLKY